MLFQFNQTTFNQILQRQLTESQIRFIGKQGLKQVTDFLLLRPRRYDKRRYDIQLSSLKVGESYSIIGKLRHISRKNVRKKLTVFNAVLVTATGEIPVVWFNQQYILEALKNDPYLVVFGKLDTAQMGVSFQVANFDVYSSLEAAGVGKVFPLYPDIRGISNKKLIMIIEDILFKKRDLLIDLCPKNILEEETLLSIQAALEQFHFPNSQDQLDQAIRRFSFDEFFSYLYPRRQRYFSTKTERPGIPMFNMDLTEQYLDACPYQLTGAQQRVWSTIKEDIHEQRNIFRLVQGDVGSGKTDIAILSLLLAVGSGYKGAMLVPTEILAQQHYLKLQERCNGLGVSIILLRGKQTKKQRTLVMEQLNAPEPLIVVGTHALVQDAVTIENLGMVVIDEQHRFGVFQRQALLEKSDQVPHCLFMTATPIPRTLMLTHYGDLDHDVIDEMPPGRKAAKTYYGKFSKINQVYEFIRLELQHGRQAYIVYPLIEESDQLDIQPAVSGFEDAVSIFSEYSVGLLHGKMPEQDKQHMMTQFKHNELQVLVSTTVIEVGVDVPNASVIVIMNAERFGLSQLHQLRGRVGRGKDQAHCFLVAEAKSVESKQRIKAMLDTTNGFKLAEEDLKIRGPGNLLGAQQSGDIMFSFANLADTDRIKDVIKICDHVIQFPDHYGRLIDYLDQRLAVIAEQLN